ncbi:MAG TPA: 3-ketosteroid dehydrogenase, partial [Actinobacteria bacterium]|nr:3-ketosteroid dehydrogenase [Actinomycetota bacterium]
MQDTDPVIVVGAGLSGLATALGVALRGGRAVVLESSDLVGGAAAYSGGMVWVGANHVEAREGIDDDLSLAEAYVRDLTKDHPDLLDEVAMKRWLETAPEAMEYWENEGAIRWEIIPDLADYHSEADGALELGRYLTNAVIDGSELGEWRDLLRVSPNFPVGMTYAEMHVKGRRSSSLGNEEDEEIADHAGVPAFGRTDAAAAADRGGDPLTFGTGVVASFLARVIREPHVEIRLSTPVTGLLTDDRGGVIGVRADSPAGPVELHGPVVLATSTYDWNPALVQEFLGLEPEDFSSLAPTSLTGDGITMARAIGADVAHVPATRVPIVPGWNSRSATGVSNGPEYALPHCLMVDRAGRRFCDDSYWVTIVRGALNPDDRHLPFFLIWDEQHHRKYGLGLTPPGGEYPPEFVKHADDLVDLGRELGIDGDELARTVGRFNEHAERGEDPEFGRGSVPFILRFAGDPNHSPSPVLGPLVEPPFYGTRLKFVGTGIGSSGLRADADGHVLDESGGIIPGLFAVGSVAALTTMGSGYNSGFALGRGLTIAYLIAQELT